MAVLAGVFISPLASIPCALPVLYLARNARRKSQALARFLRRGERVANARLEDWRVAFDTYGKKMDNKIKAYLKALDVYQKV